MRAVLLAALALAAAADLKPSHKPSASPSPKHSASPSPSPSAKPKPSNHAAEIWSAFFVYNNTGQSCNPPVPDSVGAHFFTARYALAGDYYLSQPYTWPSLSPIHSKTLTFAGADMAVDSVGRRAWALIGTQDWSTHAYILALSFPSDDFNSTTVTGVCEVMGMTAYGIGQLSYTPSLSAGGPWWLNTTYTASPWTTAVFTTTVPRLSKDGSIPPCTLRTVANVTDPAYSPNRLPPPIRGTDADGNPVLMQQTTSDTNASQILIQAWSALSGALVYNTTWACGYPSYLYSCPPTTGGGWPTSGLFGNTFTQGSLLMGGGDWSNQQYFQGQLPIAGTAGINAVTAAHAAAPADGGADAIPVLTYVNASSNQGTWIAEALTYRPPGAKPGSWPLYSQWVQASQGTCIAPSSYGSIMQMSISADGWLVNATLNGGTYNPGCPLRPQDFPYYSTAVCGGTAVGFPDLLGFMH